jgi:hypothetical protein
MRVEVDARLVMRDILLSEWRDHVAVIMERAVIIAMGTAVLRLRLGRGIVAMQMLAVAPRTVDEEQAVVDDAPAEDGIFSLFVHRAGDF